MKKVLFGFFGGIIFVIGAIYKLITCTKEIETAFVQAWKAWFGYAVFGDEYAPIRRARNRSYSTTYYRPYEKYYRSYHDIDDHRVELNKRKTEEGKKYEY